MEGSKKQLRKLWVEMEVLERQKALEKREQKGSDLMTEQEGTEKQPGCLPQECHPPPLRQGL